MTTRFSPPETPGTPWDDLIETFLPLVRALARHRSGGRLEGWCGIEDIVNDVWGVALEKEDRDPEAWAEIRGSDERLRGFLAATTLNTVRSQLRAKGRKQSRGLVPTTETINPLDRLPDSTRGVITRVNASMVSKMLQDALDTLPPEDREVLVMRGLEGLDRTIVAQELGISPNLVSKRMRRAVERLRNGLPPRLLRLLADGELL